jgi:dipeptidase E
MKLFLNGGGCGKQTILTYKEINKIIDHNKPVLYVPLAMDETEHPYDSCYEWIKEEISSINIPNIEMVRTFEEFADKDFNKYSLIYIGGGNTYKLLNGIKTTNTYNKLKEYIKNDGIVYGSSAGAVIFGKDINIIEVMDNNNIGLKDTSGFDYLNGISLFVHYTNYRSKYSEEENKKLTEKYTDFVVNYTKKNEKVIAFPEEDTVFFDGKNIKVIGELAYYTFENGKKEKIEI